MRTWGTSEGPRIAHSRIACARRHLADANAQGVVIHTTQAILYTVAHPNRCLDRMTGPRSRLRLALCRQSARRYRAPLRTTNLRAAAGESDLANSIRTSTRRLAQCGSDHRQSPTSVGRAVSHGTTAPR